jgi:zinc protease
MNRSLIKKFRSALSVYFVIAATVAVFGQEGIPKPGPERTVSIPAVKETKLKNGLTVAVVEKRNVPIVTVQLLIPAGSALEDMETAGLADITAAMLTKGTKTRSATQIAEEMEFLGGSINSGAGWNNSSVTISVTSDKLTQAMAILADVALNPTFPQDELELLKSQAIDGLTYNLTQPGFLSSYVSSVYSLDEHPAGGTLSSLQAIDRAKVEKFYKDLYSLSEAVLIFAGDISNEQAVRYANELFSKWPGVTREGEVVSGSDEVAPVKSEKPRAELLSRILVVDLPDSGQASVSYVKSVPQGRVADHDRGVANSKFYHASLLNSLLGGGYSSRLNQEIRIKRGLSYGAGSNFAWRWGTAGFSTRTQTKNESAPEVVELVLAEIKRLAEEESIAAAELDPRKSVLTGGFGRNIETTGGLVGALADLYTFNIPAPELNRYMQNVNAVTDIQIREFARANLFGGDVIIVGDYAKFKDDLAKRFKGRGITVIAADKINITSKTLQ